jgi:hypothetical protein
VSTVAVGTSVACGFAANGVVFCWDGLTGGFAQVFPW